MSTRNTFIEAAARAFWVSAYADHFDELASKGEARVRRFDDYMDNAPPTPDSALDLAKRFLRALEDANKRTAPTLGNLLEHCNAWDDVEGLGHYLAMEALGHGVAWSDDHPDHGLRVPDVECHTDDGKSLSWAEVSTRLYRGGKAGAR